MTQLEVGVGLPSSVPSVSRARILDWAVRAEQLGASSIASVDRLSHPSVLIGGQAPATLRRLAKWGDGWIAAAGLGGWDGAITFAERVRETWNEAGREGSPRLVVTVYSASGAHADDRARDYMREYYGFLGEAKADELAGYVLTSPERITEAYQELDEAGFDELILLPTAAEIDELAPLGQLGQAGPGRVPAGRVDR